MSSFKSLTILKTNFLPILLLIALTTCKKSPDTNNNPPPPPASNTFANPILSSGPDPWVIKHDTSYYYMHTLGNRIGLWKTSKMSELKNTSPQTIWSAPPNGANSQNVWAPEIHFIDNKWYVYYTAGASADDVNTQRTFVLENSGDDPRTGTWIDKGQIMDASADFFAIDGTVFNYDGDNYFLWSGHRGNVNDTQSIYIAKMLNPWTLASARSKISSPQYSWESAGAPPAVNEAPQILQNEDGKTFLIYSASGCWTDKYALGMLTLNEGGDPLNPADWTKSPTPVLTTNSSLNAYGPGHCTFFKSKDGEEDWILYHANPAANQGCADFRNPRMQEFSWNDDGTPNFGLPAALGLYIKPSGE